MVQEYHLNSTKASLSSVKILGYITSAEIGDGSWHGTSENFILNWQEQIRLYERLTPPSSHFQMNKSLLCFRLPFIPFKNFYSRYILVKADIDHDAYTTLLLSTASDYDSKHTVGKGKKQIYAHELMDHDEDVYDASYELDPLYIDTSVDTIQAFASKFTPRSGVKIKSMCLRTNGLG
jgi:hypothetical protein